MLNYRTKLTYVIFYNYIYNVLAYTVTCKNRYGLYHLATIWGRGVITNVYEIHSCGNRSVPEIFEQFIRSSLGVPLISSSHDFSNFANFIKMFTTSCLMTVLTNQKARE